MLTAAEGGHYWQAAFSQSEQNQRDWGSNLMLCIDSSGTWLLRWRGPGHAAHGHTGKDGDHVKKRDEEACRWPQTGITLGRHVQQLLRGELNPGTGSLLSGHGTSKIHLLYLFFKKWGGVTLTHQQRRCAKRPRQLTRMETLPPRL